MSGRLTLGSSLDQFKQEAKRWLKELKAGTPAAFERLNRAIPQATANPNLREVQHALAREFGYAGWTALRNALDLPAPTAALYNGMAQRLLLAYRTGTSDAMNAHYADTWHRREWDGMRTYVLADIGIHHTAGEPFPDITLDDARRWVAHDHQFRSWEELVAYLSSLPTNQRSVTRSPVGAARTDGDRKHRFLARDWDLVIDAIETRGYTTVHANGQMTDAVLARIAKIPHVTALHLGGSKELTDAGVAALSTMPQLLRVDIGGTQATDRGVAALAGLPNLERFGGDGLRVSDACGQHLSACPRLAHVNLLWTHTGDGVIAAFRGHEALRHLTTGVAVSDAGLSRLREIPRYREWTPDGMTPDTFGEAGPASLALRGNFTDRGMASLAELRGLYSLYYESAGEISAPGLATLATLDHLGAVSGQFHDAEMSVLAKFRALRHLSCQDTDASDAGWKALARSQTIEGIWGRRCHGLQSAGFRALATMPRLSNLSVSCLNVDDDALAVLPEFPSLRELMPMDIPDAGYRHIGKCLRLEKLRLMYCRATGDEATTHIVGLNNLRQYFASYTQITDETPAMLATMTSLEDVEFSAIAGISNSGVASLARSRSLRRLKVAGSHMVTSDVLTAFGPTVDVELS